MNGAVTVCAIDIETPDAVARKRAAASGRKALAHIVLEDTEGGRESVAVPPRVARALADDPLSLPASRAAVAGALAAIEERVCYAAAIDTLARRDHAEGELSRKLAHAGFSEGAVASALDRARGQRFIDDARFASYFIEERKRAGWGRHRIEQDLARRGVDIHDVPGYPDEFFSDSDDLERAFALVMRKPVPEVRGREKLIRSLVSKGFSYGVAASAVRRRMEDCQEDR